MRLIEIQLISAVESSTRFQLWQWCLHPSRRADIPGLFAEIDWREVTVSLGQYWCPEEMHRKDLIVFLSASIPPPRLFQWTWRAELRHFVPSPAERSQWPIMSTSCGDKHSSLVVSTPPHSSRRWENESFLHRHFLKSLESSNFTSISLSSRFTVRMWRRCKINAALLQWLASGCSASNAAIKSWSQVWKEVMHACEVAIQWDLRLMMNHVDGIRDQPVAWNSDPENLSYPPQAPVIL